MKERILLLNLYFGMALFIFSAILLAFQVPFMKIWFFNFAWWSFILSVDSLNFRFSKSSPLSQSLKNFLFVAFISVFVWLIFELFNLRLKNWHYRSLPSNYGERWLGYFIAFSSVMPAMLEVSFLARKIFRKNYSLFQTRVSPLFLKLSVSLGILSIFLGLGWPRIFFPLVWLCFIFLLEPFNYWLKNKTFLADLEKGEWRNIFSWLLAGLTAGFLWEFWNFWAGSHWEYSLPYLNFWRIFQMPIFGYSGFLPFALEIFAFGELFSAARRKLPKRIFLKGVVFLFFLLFYAGCFYLIDRFTVVP